MITFGIEQEIVFKDKNNTFLDFDNTKYEDFIKIINRLPIYDSDNNYFECKSLEIYPKRWYIEGIEIFDEYKNITSTIPKAIEIRTTPHKSINNLVKEFSDSFSLLRKEAKKEGFSPVLTSNNPFKDSLKKDIKLPNRTEKEKTIAKNSMTTFGMHINISIENFSRNELIELKKKINYYIPFIIPYSFSSGFSNNKKFDGLCYRNFIRAKNRELINLKRLKGIDILEFRAFDSSMSKNLLISLLYLMKGLILSPKLNKNLEKQDSDLIIRSSKFGFDDNLIKEEANKILNLIKLELKEKAVYLDNLEKFLNTNGCASQIAQTRYNKNKNIIDSISNLYDYD